MLTGGIQPVRTVLRALALCQLHEGTSGSQTAAGVRLTSKAVRKIGRRYQEAGLEQLGSHVAHYPSPNLNRQ